MVFGMEKEQESRLAPGEGQLQRVAAGYDVTRRRELPVKGGDEIRTMGELALYKK